MHRVGFPIVVCCVLIAADSVRAQSWTDLIPVPETATPTEKPQRGAGAELDTPAVVGGLKDALRLAVRRTVRRVGQQGGFSDDPAIHIPLPKRLRSVQESLKRFGLGDLGGNLEARLNRAAEQAAPEARDILVDAAMQMKLKDARAILTGPDDAATRYFRRTASGELRDALRPIVDRELSQVGAVQIYQRMLAAYEKIPFVSGVDTDLTGYTTGQTLEGIFHYIAKEEAEIRRNPAARTTALVKRLFGQ